MLECAVLCMRTSPPLGPAMEVSRYHLSQSMVFPIAELKILVLQIELHPPEIHMLTYRSLAPHLVT